MDLCRDTLRSLLWPGYGFLALNEDAFPGFEERVVYNGGDSQIE